jgi:hypothetical protein
LQHPDWGTEAQRRARAIGARRKNEIIKAERTKGMKRISPQFNMDVPEKSKIGGSLDQVKRALAAKEAYDATHPGVKTDFYDFLVKIKAEDENK